LEDHCDEVGERLGVPGITVKRVLYHFWLTLYEELEKCKVDDLTLEEAGAWETRRFLIPMIGMVMFEDWLVKKQVKNRVEGKKRLMPPTAQLQKIRREVKDVL
jgi:hypothetical protein